MALARLQKDEVYRLGLASPRAFADWTAPTAAELNANSSNDPGGLIWSLTCAINQDNSQFDLDDPDFDETLTFCQTAGNQERMTENATVVFDFSMAKDRWDDASSVLAADGFNTATLALSLMAWRGIEYFAWLSIGKSPDAAFAVGDRISLIRVATDHAIPQVSTGSKVSLNQAFAFRGDIAWRVEIAS